MINQNLKTQFEDWLLNPYEDLSCEVKTWLDIDLKENRAKIAKALIALENHGGGILIIGFTKGLDGKLTPDLNRPKNISDFNSDEFNGIVKKFAEPQFHVDVKLMTDPRSGLDYPYVVVHGKTKVPVRSDSGVEDKSIQPNIYYVRRPGPSSESPLNASDWDDLLKKCMLKNREEILNLFKTYLGTDSALLINKPNTDNLLSQFCENSYERWRVINESLEDSNELKNFYGNFSFGCQMLGESKNLSNVQIKHEIENLTRYTGWPIYVTLHDSDNAPALNGDVIETSIVKLNFPDSAHADFWRVSSKGFTFHLRGYQEDALEEKNDRFGKGKALDGVLPIWRVAEFLLRTNQLASKMYEQGYELSVKCAWRGLSGRRLVSLSGNRLFWDDKKCKVSEVTSEGLFKGNQVEDFLPEVVKNLTENLYSSFNFFEPSMAMYQEEITKLRTRSG